MSHVTFDNIFIGDSGELGKLRFNPAGFGWKSYREGDNTPTTFNGSDVRGATWLRVARNFQLRLSMRTPDKPRVTFDGFKRDEFDKLKRTLEEYFSIKLDHRDISIKGWNWGKATVENNDLVFEVQHKTAFELPLDQVANSNIAGKNEVAVELKPSSIPTVSGGREPDELVEVRFYVPTKNKKEKERGSGDEEEPAEESDEERDEEGNIISAAEALHNLIKEKADISAAVGDSIVVFDEVLIVTPRGRFSIEFFHESLRLLGKSTDYRIPFTSINRIFLLPRLDDLHVQLVLGLDPPIRQGATRYPFLVAQWPKDEEVDAELNLDDEEIAKYPELQRTYQAPTFQVISRVLKALTGKKVTPPGSFRNAQGVNGLKANVKAAQGELYFLEKGLIFISKQPILIDFSKTESIAFSRIGGGIASARTFDMRVVSKMGLPDTVFTALNKEEIGPISQYLASKNVRLKNEMEDSMEVDNVIDDDLSDDDDDVSINSEDEGKKKKKKGTQAKARKPADEESESDDEDFMDESSDGGSPSESDDDDDDSGFASDASDPMMEELRKKQETKKKKKAADSGDEAPKKKKAKMDVD